MFHVPGFFLFFRGVGGGGRGTFSLKLPRIRYQKTKIPIFEDFFKIKNSTKICLVSYKFYHRMITPNSNIFQRQYNIDADPIYATQLVLRPRKLIKNGVGTMKELLKLLTGRYKMALPPYVSL